MTVAKLSLWSVNYYNDTARAVGDAVADRQKANGGLAEYYAERDTRTPVWACAGDVSAVAELVGLSAAERAGGDADPDVVARWLDEGVAPSGECGRAHGVFRLHKALVCQNADDDARFGFRFRRLRAGDSGVRRRLRGQDEPDQRIKTNKKTNEKRILRREAVKPIRPEL